MNIMYILIGFGFLICFALFIIFYHIIKELKLSIEEMEQKQKTVAQFHFTIPANSEEPISFETVLEKAKRQIEQSQIEIK